MIEWLILKSGLILNLVGTLMIACSVRENPGGASQEINGKEIWSYLGHGKLTKILPKKIIIKIFEKVLLKKAFENGFLTDSDEGGQHFIIAKRI